MQAPSIVAGTAMVSLSKPAVVYAICPDRTTRASQGRRYDGGFIESLPEAGWLKLSPQPLLLCRFGGSGMLIVY